MADKPVFTKKFNEGFDLEGKIGEGGVHAKIYLGVQGNDLKTAKKAFEDMLFKKLAAESSINLLEVRMFDIKKDKGAEYFSGVAEVSLVADDFRWFLNMILRYGPSAVEIMEPSEVKLGTEQMHSVAADVSDFVHMYSQQIIAMYKDPERRALLDKMLKGE
jgi:hypothetical protein